MKDFAEAAVTPGFIRMFMTQSGDAAAATTAANSKKSASGWDWGDTKSKKKSYWNWDEKKTDWKWE